MNLATLITTIGQRTGLIGPRDLAACKAFVQLRYDQLWRAFLWKDSLVEYVVAIDPGTAYMPTAPYLPTKGHLVLPSIIGSVVAVRSNLDKMNVERPMMYFRVGQDQFSKTGRPCEFYLLSSCVWEFDVVENLRLGLVNVADAFQNVTLDSLAADGVTVNRVVTPLQVLDVDITASDRIDAMLKAISNGMVKLKAVTLGDNLIPAGATYATFDAGNNKYFYTVAGVVANATYRLTGGDNDEFLQVNGTFAVQLNPGITAPDYTMPAVPGVVKLYSSDANAPVTATMYPVTVTDVITLPATDTAAPKRQRVRFVRIPDSGLTIRVLGKRITPQLTDDNDEPAVSGMDGVLYAMATYDMAHRDEFSKVGAAEAQMHLAESVGPNFLTNGVAGGFLKKLIEEETDQAAFNSRIMPEAGFGGHDFDEFRATKSSPY